MARFDRYLLSRLMVLFGFAALVLILVYWINRAVILFERLIGDGQGVAVFLEFTVLSLPGLIRIVLPLAAFAASLYVTNRMTEESELVVVQATGFSPWRLARPVLLFGLIVTGLMSILTHVLVPAATTRLSEREVEIANTATTRLLREGQFQSPVEGVTLFVRVVTPEGELQDIFLSDSRQPDETITYTASRAFVIRTERGPQLVMIDGLAQTLSHDSRRLGITSFSDFAYDIAPFLSGDAREGRNRREVGTLELLRASPALMAETGNNRAQLLLEGHNRFAEPLLATVAALIGFATLLVGGFSRFGVWRQILVAIVLIILVKLTETVTTSAVRGDPRLWPLIYLPTGFGLGLVWTLLTLAARPGFLRRHPRRGAAA